MTVGPTLKSAQITNLDSTPIVRNTAGESGSYTTMIQDGFVTPAAADAAGTKYLMARVKSNVKVKSVSLASEAQGAGKVDVGVYYADDARYLAPGNSANLGLVVPSMTQLFASDVDLAAKVSMTDVTFESGNYTFDKWFQPLWQACGLTTDPGGFFDILAVVHTTDVTTGTGKLYVRVGYVEP